MRLAPTLDAVQFVTPTDALDAVARSVESATVVALKATSPEPTVIVDPDTAPSVRLAIDVKVALPCRSAFDRFSVPTAESAAMPVSDNCVALVIETLVAADVPVN